MTNHIFMSVVRAWRFADTKGRIDVTHDKASYRKLIGDLHGGAEVAGPFRLPWPPFPSNFWEHHLNRPDYQSTPPDVLVRLLVPRRLLLGVDYERLAGIRTPLAELFVEPFGVWTALTVALASQTDDHGAVADRLDEALHAEVARDRERLGLVVNGIDADTMEAALDAVPWQGIIPKLVEAGTITLVTGLSPPGADVKERAALFRTRFLGKTGGTAHAFTRSTGAASTTSSQVGITLADIGQRSAARVKCLHHNHTLLAGHLLTFGSLIGAEPVAEAGVYRQWAARVLNHLHRGEPLSGAGIYKSRVAPAWIEHAGLIPTINHVTAAFPTDPVPPLAPAPVAKSDGTSDDG